MLVFDWDEANLSHIALHSVTAGEAEQVLSSFTYELYAYELDGEERIEEVGATHNGRILKVVTTVREGAVRVVTAYEPSKSLKQTFLEYQRKIHE